MNKYLLAIILSIMSVGTYAQLPYFQDFEITTFPPSGWQTFSSSSANWKRDTTASGYGIGIACTSFDNFNTPAGGYAGIRLPTMNFTNVSQPYIRFDIAYAQRPGTGSDIFGLYWSNNGTTGWQTIVNYSGATLTTAPPTANLFVPTPAQWQTKTRSLLSLAGLPFVRLAIEDDCNHGNKMYFDNVLVFDSATVGVNETIFSSQLNIFPDPFNTFINIIPDSKQKINKAGLYNIMGALVASPEKSNGILKMENLSGLPEGIYFLRLDVQNEKALFRKLTKIND